MSFFNASEHVAPGQPPRSGMGADGRVMTPLPASLTLSHQPSVDFFAAQDSLPAGKRRSNLHNLASPEAAALKSSMVATTPQAQSKTDSIIPPSPDPKRRRGAASELSNKSVRTVSFNDARNIEHSTVPAAMLESHLLPPHGVPESDGEQDTGLSRAEPPESSEDPAKPAANFGAGILNCEAEKTVPGVADDSMEEQAEVHVSHQEQTQQKTPAQQEHDAELEQELEEDDIDMADNADNVDESQSTMLVEDAVKAMPQAAKLHADSMEKMVSAGQDAGQAICSIVQEMYAAILTSLTKYADEVSQKAIAIGDERENQSNQQAKIDQTYEQTSQVAGIMQAVTGRP